MAADFTALNASIQQLTQQVQATQGVEASAAALINGYGDAVKKAVSDALAADDAADQGSVQAAQAAVDGVTKQFADSASTLGAAVTSNSGNTGTGSTGTAGSGGTGSTPDNPAS